MAEHTKPTHVLTITVPLDMDDLPYDYNPVRDAIHIALSISRAAFSGHICDTANVSVEEVGS